MIPIEQSQAIWKCKWDKVILWEKVVSWEKVILWEKFILSCEKKLSHFPPNFCFRISTKFEFLPNFRISTKFQNLVQILESPPNFRISTKFQNLDQISESQPFRILTKFQNFNLLRHWPLAVSDFYLILRKSWLRRWWKTAPGGRVKPLLKGMTVLMTFSPTHPSQWTFQNGWGIFPRIHHPFRLIFNLAKVNMSVAYIQGAISSGFTTFKFEDCKFVNNQPFIAFASPLIKEDGERELFK